MQRIYEYIESLMAQCQVDPTMSGWSMQTIMTQVGDKFGEDNKSVARAYIMSKCGVTDDE